MLLRLFVDAHIHGDVIHVVGGGDLHLLVELVRFYRREVPLQNCRIRALLIVDGAELGVLLILRIVSMVEGPVGHQALDRSGFFDLFRIRSRIVTDFSSGDPLGVHKFGNLHLFQVVPLF